jgi:protoheme ferro-lyase
MERIYHPYWLWEDYKNGFYENISGEEKKQMILKVIEMFNSEKLTIEYMNRVINEWIYSCEHNLTNDSLNKIAYIGQGACCIYAKVPNTITMEAWSLLDKEIQYRANKIAIEVINKWINKNKFIQLCLKLD